MAAGTHEALAEASAAMVARIRVHEEARDIYAEALKDLHAARHVMEAAHAAEVEAHGDLAAELAARKKARR